MRAKAAAIFIIDLDCLFAAKRHFMVGGTLAPLHTAFGLKLGSNGTATPDRGQNPVEWEDFPFVHSSIAPSIPLHETYCSTRLYPRSKILVYR